MSSVFCFLLTALSLVWVLTVISPQVYRPLMLLIGVWAVIRSKPARGRWGPLLDTLWVITALLGLGWPLAQGDAFLYRAANPTGGDVLCGTLAVLAVIEAARRTTGWILPISAIAFLAYAFAGPWLGSIGLGGIAHRGYDLPRLIGNLYMTLEGIYGVPLDVAVTYIVLFTLYGALLERSGAGQFFLNFAMQFSTQRHSPSAAGRSVTLAGFLLGTVSGSGVATTVTLGSVAWPVLRRVGFAPETAGGMLAASGIGALLSPPTLGAAAFLIAEYLRISYLQVLVMATMPTILYYLSIVLMIEGDSRRLGGSSGSTPHNARPTPQVEPTAPTEPLQPSTESSAVLHHFAVPALQEQSEPTDRKLDWSAAIEPASDGGAIERPRWQSYYHFTSLVLVAVLMTVGFTAFRAVFWASIAAVVMSVLGRRDEWLGPGRLMHAMIAGGADVLPVLATTAVAGIIVGVVTLTGLGLKAAMLIVGLGSGSVFLTVLLAAVAVWILGLAVPVTASYIISAVMVVPALTSVGVPPIAAHMFIFYYAVLSEVSPPTALAPFAAAALTGGKPFTTMLVTWKYALPAFVVPFAFAIDPRGLGLLMQADWLTVTMTAGSALIGVAALAMASAGLGGRLSVAARIAVAVSGLLLLHPAPTWDLVGAAGLALTGLLYRMTRTA